MEKENSISSEIKPKQSFKVVFVSNFMNAHQLTFCNELYDLLDHNLIFIETERFSEDRKKMKFSMDNSKSKAKILSTFDNSNSLLEAKQLILNADFVIFGSAPVSLLVERLKEKKTILYYTERIFRNGRYRILNPFFIKFLWDNYYQYYNNNLYLLSVGKFTKLDFDFLHLFKNKSFKWGYFPEFIPIDIDSLHIIKAGSPTIQILWVGRLLWWKHPEKCIYLAKALKLLKYDFKIKIIGEGPKRDNLKKLIIKYKLNEYIELCDFLPFDQIQKEMQKSSIYLMTSDQNEGWGVVVNEAMNNGCTVVGSNLVGSVTYLIEHEKNGLIYNFNSKSDLLRQVLKLFKNPELRFRFSINAYKKILNTWNPKIAAENLFKIMKLIKTSKLSFIDNIGPGEKIID